MKSKRHPYHKSKYSFGFGTTNPKLCASHCRNCCVNNPNIIICTFTTETHKIISKFAGALNFTTVDGNGKKHKRQCKLFKPGDYGCVTLEFSASEDEWYITASKRINSYICAHGKSDHNNPALQMFSEITNRVVVKLRFTNTCEPNRHIIRQMVNI